MSSASDIIARITELEASKLSKLSDKEEPLNSEQLEQLELLSKIVKQLLPSYQVSRAASGMSEAEALRVIRADED